jgi:hypothetical protein
MSFLCVALTGAVPARADMTAPIAIAVFDFELEDFSPSGSPAGETPAEAGHLAEVTREARQLLAASRRYRLVDVGAADAPAATSRTLRDCGGCDAAIALEMGAEQSLVGVVRRISRTEYMVRFQIRDARTGSLVSDAKSGLRMGADYSWHRGAARLIKDRLLATEERR